MESRKIEKISDMFQIFNMPRFSCIITECRKAVPVSQGIREAFSTGSQPQFPPQPSTELRPVRAQKNATGQEYPGDHGSAGRDVSPLLAGIAHDERHQRKGKGHGETDIAEVEHGRMDHHLGILEQRIQTITISWQRGLHDDKRMGREIQKQKEENLNRCDDD
jgi:hypothetical protein